MTLFKATVVFLGKFIFSRVQTLHYISDEDYRHNAKYIFGVLLAEVTDEFSAGANFLL